MVKVETCFLVSTFLVFTCLHLWGSSGIDWCLLVASLHSYSSVSLLVNSISGWVLSISRNKDILKWWLLLVKWFLKYWKPYPPPNMMNVHLNNTLLKLISERINGKWTKIPKLKQPWLMCPASKMLIKIYLFSRWTSRLTQAELWIKQSSLPTWRIGFCLLRTQCPILPKIPEPSKLDFIQP